VSDATLRIKNLSIALEALSRVPGVGECSMAIEVLLQEEIRKFREEQEKEMQWPHQGPARTTACDKDPYAKDDKIPF